MYKIKDESEHHYEIETPEGGSFHVAKAGLTKPMHERIKKMCEGGMAHYDEGTTDAQPEDVEAPAPAAQEGAPQMPASAPQEVPNTPMSPDVAGQYAEAFERERQGLQTGEQGQIEQSKEAQQAIGDQVVNAQDELAAHQEREADRLQKQSELAKEIANTKIDPKAYFNNLSTPGKISTVLGLVLGGIGAGASGINQAVNVLDNQIKQDVEAQKANLENKNSLFNKYLEMGKDEREATALTQSQQLSIAQQQLAQAAAKAQTPAAQQAYMLGTAAIDQKQAAISQQLYLYNLQNKIATGGRFDANLAPFAKNPASVVSFGDGTAIQASSPQAAGKVQEVLGQHQPPIDTLNRLEQLAVNPLTPLSPQYQQAKALTATLLTQLKGVSGLGRLSPEGIKILEQTFNNPTELREVLLHDERTKALKRSLIEQRDAKIAPYLPSYRARPSLGFKSAQ